LALQILAFTNILLARYSLIENYTKRKIKREVNKAKREALKQRKAAYSSRAQLQKAKDEFIREMRASKWAYKATEKKLNTTIRKYQRNRTIALN
jgi:hypothetical protein